MGDPPLDSKKPSVASIPLIEFTLTPVLWLFPLATADDAIDNYAKMPENYIGEQQLDRNTLMAEGPIERVGDFRIFVGERSELEDKAEE